MTNSFLTKIKVAVSHKTQKKNMLFVKSIFDFSISRIMYLFTRYLEFNPFAPRDFAKKRVLKLVEWFSGHSRAMIMKS